MFVSTESLAAVAAHVAAEYGPGHGIRLLEGRDRGGNYQVATPDGAYFRVSSDRYGNVARLCDNVGCWQPAATCADHTGALSLSR